MLSMFLKDLSGKSRMGTCVLKYLAGDIVHGVPGVSVLII